MITSKPGGLMNKVLVPFSSSNLTVKPLRNALLETKPNASQSRRGITMAAYRVTLSPSPPPCSECNSSGDLKITSHHRLSCHDHISRVVFVVNAMILDSAEVLKRHRRLSNGNIHLWVVSKGGLHCALVVDGIHVTCTCLVLGERDTRR